MQEALDQFASEAQKIIGAFVEAVRLRPRPERIYHYTNDAGLKGILESGKLWLTEICNLNDPSELNHGFKIATDELKDMVAGRSPVSRKFSDDLKFISEQKRVQKSADFFVCSFSLCGNDLGQWRAYADNGRGFVLEFDTGALENEGAPDSFPLTYSDSELAKLDHQIIDKMLHLTELPSCKDDLSIALMTYVTQAAIFFKDSAYKCEKEYRFLETFSLDNPPCVKWRSRRYSLIRYREFAWRNGTSNALKQIIVGPAADQERASQFARKCLDLYPESGDVQIDLSKIPYRAV